MQAWGGIGLGGGRRRRRFTIHINIIIIIPISTIFSVITIITYGLRGLGDFEVKVKGLV